MSECLIIVSYHKYLSYYTQLFINICYIGIIRYSYVIQIFYQIYLSTVSLPILLTYNMHTILQYLQYSK